jgi:Tol biopolymer transport system component/DNA-binding winged helix-turn-helix (wHTH) protein
LQSSPHSGDVVRFGPFEVDLAEAVLRKHGVKVRLQAQPFQVLAALLEKPGTAVTRDELRQRLWKDDTFVDFEHGLNAAVTRLRQALGDSAEQPRYVETLAKRGYKFSANVERLAVDIEEEAPSRPVAAPKRRTLFWIAAVLLVGGIGVFSLISNHVAIRVELPVPPGERAVPFTAFRGIEADPALSPDGNHVAFTWNGEKQDNVDVYIMPIGSDVALRLTTDLAEDVSPAWSPDGRTIAFVRKLGDGRGDLLLIPATGGPEHKLREIRNAELRASMGRLVSLAWSPDGGWIAVSHRNPGDSSECIYLFSLTGETRRLTAMPGRFGDHTPAFSPDGRTLAFSRLAGFSTSEIYTLPLNSKFQPMAEARRLTTGKRWCVNPVWLPEGNRILYLTADEPAGPHQLRMISAFGRETSGKHIPLNDDCSEITVGRRLVYSRRKLDTNIWRARIARAGEPPFEAELFISSTRRDEKPRYSPDGRKIAFTSSRSGSPEIWVSKADGSSPVRMTAIGGPLVGYANWSPDGQWLIFHARPEGQADVFVMPAAGGSPKRLTTDVADDAMPSYSHDGRWIYFSSSHSGRNEIWRMPAAGGEAVQLTTSGGQRPFESPDGKSIFYMTLDGREIRCVPAGGGPSLKVAAPIHGYPSGFAVTSQGVYYGAPPHSGDERFVRFLSFSTGDDRPVAVAHYPFYLGMSVSPDANYILLDQIDEFDRDLLLVKDFRP